MSNTTLLLLQLCLSVALIWLCWEAYPYWCDFWYPKFSKDERDEHEDVDRARW